MCTSLTKDVVPEWQGAASCLLTTLGITHAPAVLQELLKRFQPGSTPHYFVVKTTGDLAMANGENLMLIAGGPRSGNVCSRSCVAVFAGTTNSACITPTFSRVHIILDLHTCCNV